MPDLRKARPAPLFALAELLRQFRTAVGLTRAKSTTRFRTRLLSHLLTFVVDHRAPRARGPAGSTFIDPIVGAPPLATTAATNRNRCPSSRSIVRTRHRHRRRTRARRLAANQVRTGILGRPWHEWGPALRSHRTRGRRLVVTQVESGTLIRL